MSSPSPSTIAEPAPGYTISTNPDFADHDWIVRSVQGSYWGKTYSREQIEAALERSIVVGAYAGGRQIGFVRIVSDGSIFSSITDVFVEPEQRGKGVGSAMMDAAVALPEVRGTICILQALPLAQLWYMKWSFRLVGGGAGIMQRGPG